MWELEHLILPQKRNGLCFCSKGTEYIWCSLTFHSTNSCPTSAELVATPMASQNWKQIRGLLESRSKCQIQSEKQWEHHRVKPVLNHKVPNLIKGCCRQREVTDEQLGEEERQKEQRDGDKRWESRYRSIQCDWLDDVLWGLGCFEWAQCCCYSPHLPTLPNIWHL